MPEFLLSLAHSLGNLRRILHVKLHSEGVLFVPGDEFLHLIGIARRHDRTPTAGEHESGKFLPEAGRAAGDKPYRRLLLGHTLLLLVFDDPQTMLRNKCYSRHFRRLQFAGD